MKTKGFTLIEILLVVVIIGILGAMLAPNIVGKSDQARLTAAHTDIESNVATALDLYHMDTGKYPTSEQGLAALITAPSAAPVPTQWNGPYLKKKKIPKDPWGHEYVYVYPGVHNKESYDLSSPGSDGIESADDVNNWESK